MFRAETSEQRAEREAIPFREAIVIVPPPPPRREDDLVVVKRGPGRQRKVPYVPPLAPVDTAATDEPEAKKKRVNTKWSNEDVKVVFRVLAECVGNRAKTVRALQERPYFEEGRFVGIK